MFGTPASTKRILCAVKVAAAATSIAWSSASNAAVVEFSFTASGVATGGAMELLGMSNGDAFEAVVTIRYENASADSMPTSPDLGVYPDAHLSATVDIGPHVLDITFANEPLDFTIQNSATDTWHLAEGGDHSATFSSGPLTGEDLTVFLAYRTVDDDGTSLVTDELPSHFPALGWDYGLFDLFGDAGELGFFSLSSDINIDSITSTSPTPVPLPTALPLFTGGLGLFGLLGWRRIYGHGVLNSRSHSALPN